MEQPPLKAIGHRLRQKIAVERTILPEQMQRLLEKIEQPEQRKPGRMRDPAPKRNPS
jgi:hypothetical protein